MLVFYMAEYTIEDIEIISALEAIRRRPYMYVLTPRNPMKDIITLIEREFDRLSGIDYRVSESSKTCIIEAKQDWLSNDITGARISIEERFNELSLGGEVFLNAFYFPFYTNGPVGKLGESHLLRYCDEASVDKFIGAQGRVLIISKTQNLPEKHGIIFDRPTQTPAAQENEKRWETLVDKS